MKNAKLDFFEMYYILFVTLQCSVRAANIMCITISEFMNYARYLEFPDVSNKMFLLEIDYFNWFWA